MAGHEEFRDGFQIPTVTEHDLRAFHAKHLSPQAVTNFPFSPILDIRHPELEDDDGLGYYADGVKRTLTEEQIAMFRHSEIQTLLRERRHARENREAEMSEEGEIGEDKIDGVAVDCTKDGLHSARHASEPFTSNSEVLWSKKPQEPSSKSVAGRDHLSIDSTEERPPGNDAGQTRGPTSEALDDEDEAYEEFLRNERLQMAREVKKRKRGLDNPIERDEANKTERRIAREQDESKYVGGELDYGDDSGLPNSSITKPTSKGQQSQLPLGRRIVAYGDGDEAMGNARPSSPIVKQPERKSFLWPKIGS
ncbi:MAG: hypothetical protein M1812_006455 [Candelaria pacifica]|nr:MAG: hypothetical protein M1812_006455 [Candelaria pacifica]